MIILLLNSCTPKPLITELSNTTTTYNQTILINNCGNKADSSQTASRSFSTKIAGAGTFTAGYDKIIEGSVATTYEQYRNITTTQTLTAAPNTNMEFILKWSDDVHVGNATINGESANYTVNIPISVAQISSQDFGCGIGVIQLPQSTKVESTDKIAGTWIGVTNWNEYQGLQNTISIKSGCVVGDICGTTRMDSQYWCAGDLVLSKINGDTFTFIQTNQKGNVPDNGCDNGAIETMYLLSPDKLSWSVSRSTGNNPGTGSGTLLKQP